MRYLNTCQRACFSDFFNKIAAAWFTAGTITPFFTGQAGINQIITKQNIITLLVGLGLSFLFLGISLFFVKE
jgi:hypothetical protein